MKARVSGKLKLERAFKQLPDVVQDEAVKAAVKSAEELATAQQAVAPVDAGDLRDSITVTGPGETTPPHSQPGGKRRVPDYAAVVTAGNDEVRYAHLVEYGTVKTPAQPYFWPPYRLLKRRLTGRITRQASKAIRQLWRR